MVLVQDYELDMLPGSERKLESSLKDVQTKLEVVKQLHPLWLRSCLPPRHNHHHHCLLPSPHLY